MKRLAFVGSSRSDLKDFPETARRKAGFQLERVRRGLEPEDWKPMTSVGAGVREIWIKEASGAFRLIYVAAFAEAVFMLLAFQKKAQRTSMRDLGLATARYK
jgi:phage-related protein